MSDIKGAGRRRISHANGADIQGLFWLSEHRLTWTQEQNGKITQLEFDLESGRLTKVPPARGREANRIDKGENWSLQRADSPKLPLRYREVAPLESFYELKGHPSLWIKDFGLKNDRMNPTIQRAGEQHRIKLGWGHFIDFYQSNRRGQDWLVTFNTAGSAGYSMGLYLIDWKTSTPRKIADGMTGYQLSTDEQLWAASEGMRPLRNWGPTKKVWTSQIWAGGMDGESWCVTPGLVLASEIRLRPGFRM